MEPHLSEDEKPRNQQEARALKLWQSYLSGDKSQLDTGTRTVRQIFKHCPPHRAAWCAMHPFRV